MRLYTKTEKKKKTLKAILLLNLIKTDRMHESSIITKQLFDHLNKNFFINFSRLPLTIELSVYTRCNRNSSYTHVCVHI